MIKMPKDQPKENDKDLYEGTPHKKKFFPRIALIPGGGDWETSQIWTEMIYLS